MRMCYASYPSTSNQKAIMKEKPKSFILAYSSPLLQDNTVQSLGCSGEVQLSKNMLLNRTYIETTEDRLKDLMKLFHN